MKTQIIILYPYENSTSVPALAGLYHEILQRQGYAVSSFCTSDYPSSAELFDAITSEASPDFGISLNLAGLNFLNTGEDSILMKLPCPFAHELLMPPYYVNRYLDTRINFNHIVYVHRESDASYIRNYYPDIPAVCTTPKPDWETRILPLRKAMEASAVAAEIKALPDVFSMLCQSLIEKLKMQPDAIFHELVVTLLGEYGITDMTREESIELITMCSLASEYVDCTAGGAEIFSSPQETLVTLLQNANPICANISANCFS